MWPWMAGFLSGVWMLPQGDTLWPAWLCLIGVSVGAGIWLLPRAGAVWLLLAGFTGGMGWVGVSLHELAGQRLPEAQRGQVFWLEGRLAAMPVETTSFDQPRWRADLQVERQRLARESDWSPATLSRVRLSFRQRPGLPGDCVRVKVKLDWPAATLNTAGLDAEIYAFAQGVGAQGKAISVLPARACPGDPTLRQRAEHWRSRLVEATATALAKASHGRVAGALALGDQSRLTPLDWQLFQASGTSHLFVVSGLQIGLAAGAVFWLCNLVLRRIPRLMLYVPRQSVALVLAALAGWGYALLAGYSLPTARSALALVIGALVALLAGGTSPARLLGFGVLALVLGDPLCLQFPSVWLSCLAVAALGLGFAGRLRAPGIREAAWRSQWVVFIALLPVLAAWFQLLPLLAVLVNMVAVPLTNVVGLGCALAATLLASHWPDAARVVWWPADKMFAGLWWLMELCARWPWQLYWSGQPGRLALAVAAVGVVLLLLPRGMPGRWLGAVLLLPALWSPAERPPRGALEMRVLDVGQGLAVLVRTREHSLLFDTGRTFGNGQDSGRLQILPVLRALGERRLDALVVSHADTDHSGGVRSLLAELTPKEIWLGEPVAGVVGRPCQAGNAWQWDDVHFEFLWPEQAVGEAGSAWAGNDRSCVLRIRSAQGRYLIPGDISERVERLLLAGQAGKLPADVLLAAHHGSRSSSSEEFLRQVAARHVVMSAGRENLFGHPHPDVLERLSALEGTVWQTALSGGLRFSESPDGIVVHTARDRRSGVWRQLLGDAGVP